MSCQVRRRAVKKERGDKSEVTQRERCVSAASSACRMVECHTLDAMSIPHSRMGRQLTARRVTLACFMRRST